jgi:hypothetical protein
MPYVATMGAGSDYAPGGRYSFRKDLYHTPSTRGRSSLVNQHRLGLPRAGGGVRANELNHHEGFAERSWHRTESPASQGDRINPVASCVSTIEHMVIGTIAGIARSSIDRRKEHSLGPYRHQGHKPDNRGFASASPPRARPEKMTAAGLRLIAWSSLTR